MEKGIIYMVTCTVVGLASLGFCSTRSPHKTNKGDRLSFQCLRMVRFDDYNCNQKPAGEDNMHPINTTTCEAAKNTAKKCGHKTFYPSEDKFYRGTEHEFPGCVDVVFSFASGSLEIPSNYEHFCCKKVLFDDGCNQKLSREDKIHPFNTTTCKAANNTAKKCDHKMRNATMTYNKCTEQEFPEHFDYMSYRNRRLRIMNAKKKTNLPSANAELRTIENYDHKFNRTTLLALSLSTNRTVEDFANLKGWLYDYKLLMERCSNFIRHTGMFESSNSFMKSYACLRGKMSIRKETDTLVHIVLCIFFMDFIVLFILFYFNQNGDSKHFLSSYLILTFRHFVSKNKPHVFALVKLLIFTLADGFISVTRCCRASRELKNEDARNLIDGKNETNLSEEKNLTILTRTEGETQHGTSDKERKEVRFLRKQTTDETGNCNEKGCDIPAEANSTNIVEEEDTSTRRTSGCSIGVTDDEEGKMQTTSELVDEMERTLCKVCFDKEMNVVFLPCHHLVTCENCADRFHCCVVCRALIEGSFTVNF